MGNSNSIISTKDLDNLKEYTFRIPLYQRPYAWQEEHIIQLLEDLKTFYEKYEKQEKKYYLGNIVVSKIDEKYFDVIDGQQRLTTLYLFLKIVNKECFKLEYEIREEDNNFLKNFDTNNSTDTLKDNIKAIQNWQKENENYSLDNLLQKIEITLTQIPKEVDVVKYFEVMNNRGKQLEKHQILKAKFLDVLRDNKEYNYAKIWDYCSEMSIPIEYLIYYNDFKKEDKTEGAFKNLRQKLLNFNFDEIKSENTKIFKTGYEDTKATILNIIKPSKSKDKENKNIEDTDKKDDFYSRKEYKSIIKFPIFLIQVLKIFIAKNNNLQNNDFKSLDEIIVNDRYLLDYFFEDKTHTKFLFDKDLAKDFVLFLFKARILFDYYIFKRNDKDEPEFITRENKDLLMIELLFNVSAPQYFAQDWVVVVLSFLSYLLDSKELDNLEKIDKKLIEFLEQFDNKMQQIRLSSGEIIKFINEKIKNPENNSTYEDIDKEQLNKILNQGTSTPHYWFYKLDYLLWKNYDFNQGFENKFKFDYSKIKEKYRLSRLNSIEHIFPQSKQDVFRQSDECMIDYFGNLALISNHLNSSLIDEPFENKRTIIQKQLNNGTIESLKMLIVYNKYNEWNSKNCIGHQKEMLEILIKRRKKNDYINSCTNSI